jgi:16S rRNA (cytosine1402-N4)-methyltransferase
VIVHQPVLLKEVLSLLVPPVDGGLFVDATLGEGGHAEAFLLKYPRLSVIGVDADPSIQAAARERLRPFGARVRFVNSWFGDFFGSYDEPAAPDLVLMDLGVSRFHFEASGRGFSFDRDEPLDMRLSPGLTTSAADIVNDSGTSELADILQEFGQERFARRIAARLVRERTRSPIDTAARLAAVVAAAVPASHRHGRIHPATRTFQALRIAVNRELEQIEEGVAQAVRVLAPEGRIGVIAFHSLEDRIVKRLFREKSRSCTCPPEWPICQCGGRSELRLVTTKPLTATDEEVALNPASRSARLRVAQKPRRAPEGPR